MNIHEMQVIDTEDGEEEMNVYANVEDTYDDCMMSGTENSDTKRKQTSQHTGSECVRMRSYRSVTVCLVLLCVLLLTAVIVLCVLINTNNQQCHIKSKNLTEERDQLLTKYTKLTEDKDLLQTKYTKLTEDSDLLRTKYTKLTEDSDLLRTKYTKLTEERDQLQTKYTNITEERNQLLLKSKSLTTKNERLLTNNSDLHKQKEQLTQQINEILKADGWIYYQSSLYFNSSEKKSWSESRRYCRERGADLIIVNNKEEQDFIRKNYGEDGHWIGLSDSEERWKLVNTSTLNSTRFWESGDTSGQIEQKCVVSYSLEWYYLSCNSDKKWICERNILK